MTDEQRPLTAAERAELEQLRAEKRERERAAQARREWAELEQLRSMHDAYARKADVGGAKEERKGKRSIMEPDDDLSMPLGQKIVLVAIALIVLAIVVSFVLSSR